MTRTPTKDIIVSVTAISDLQDAVKELNKRLHAAYKLGFGWELIGPNEVTAGHGFKNFRLRINTYIEETTDR